MSHRLNRRFNEKCGQTQTGIARRPDQSNQSHTRIPSLRQGALGPGGFEKGDVWVTAEGCPVKLVLDSELHKNDGSLLDKVHYEEAMIKK